MTSTLTEVQFSTDLPDFSSGDYPTDTTDSQILLAFAQSEEKKEPLIWRRRAYTLVIDAQANRISLVDDEHQELLAMATTARLAAVEIAEAVILCWENWEARFHPSGEIEMALLAGFDIDQSIRDAQELARHFEVEVEVSSGYCQFAVNAHTKAEETAVSLITSTKRLALAQLLGELPEAIKQGAGALNLWLGKLANHGSENPDLIEMAGVVASLTMSNLNLSDLMNGFIGAAIADLSAYGILSPAFISAAETLSAEDGGEPVEIAQTVTVDQAPSLSDAWREAFLATYIRPDYVRFAYNDHTFYTDYSGILVVDIPQGANFAAAFFTAWLAVAELEHDVSFHWSGRKFTLNSAREIFLSAGPRETLADAVDFALLCAANLILPGDRSDSKKALFLDFRGRRFEIPTDAAADDICAWIVNQFCAGHCHQINS